MLKQLFVLFNLASLIVVTALLPADVKVDTSLEEQMKRDSSYLVEITIHKAQIFGFAKFQQDLPPGFEATPVETADASFTFADNKVKFIWMALPETETIVVSYELTPMTEAPAEGIVEGKFSYIEDNKRKSYDLPNIPIKVLGAEEGPQEVEPTARVMRIVESSGDNEYLVTLSVEKEGISGFAKIEEYLPPEAEAIPGNTKLAVFSQVDEKAKFVWMSVPEDEEFVVSYSVKSSSDIMDELSSMEGSFSYLDGDQTKAVAVIGSAPPGEAPEMAMEEQPSETTGDEAVVEEGTTAEEEVLEEEEPVETVAGRADEQEAPAKDAPSPATEPKQVTSVPDPETGVRYRVQIIAGHRMVTTDHIRKTYGFSDPYATENHEGWIKYTTGSYPVYKQARDQREALVAAQHDFPGPFVTAYNQGERITVQEALMITNQKWFK